MPVCHVRQGRRLARAPLEARASAVFALFAALFGISAVACFALAERLLGPEVAVRDVGLLGSAVARPQTTAVGTDAYPDIWTKTAALLQSIVNNHALVDGNKRLGWLATAVFLELNDVHATAARNYDVCELVMGVASTQVDPPVLASRLHTIVNEA